MRVRIPLINRSESHGSPFVYGSHHKTNKFPDPPILTDGENPSFNIWRSRVRGKLRGNNDHFNGEGSKLDYVLTRIEQIIYEYLEPRFKNGITDFIKIVDELIEKLASFFEDPDKENNWDRKYEALH